MSYLSTTENVGFSGIPQNISDASCATQYKMAVEGVSGNCSEVNMFIHDSSGDEQTYVTHLNDNYFHTKFKIDPNELYTFHDSDVIAGEITVSHTEDNFIFPDSGDANNKFPDSPDKEIDVIGSIANGDIKENVEKEVISNGHYPVVTKSLSLENYTNAAKVPTKVKDKTSNAKVSKGKTQSHASKEIIRLNSASDVRRPRAPSPKAPSTGTASQHVKNSTSNVDTKIASSTNAKTSTAGSSSGMETFLDVFKREQGLVETAPIIKTENQVALPPPAKVPVSAPKKTPSGKTPNKPRRGRGPAVHEALQRIPAAQKRVVPVANHAWHAPGHELASCGPLDDRTPIPFSQLESSSSDDDNVPDFGNFDIAYKHKMEQGNQSRSFPVANNAWQALGHELASCGPLDDRTPIPFSELESSSSDDDNVPDFAAAGPACVEEAGAESRGARLALRRAALRRHVARAHTALKLATDHRRERVLASCVKEQLRGQGAACRLPTSTVNRLLAMRGMTSLLTSHERRRLREAGWSGGESGTTISSTGSKCAEERCTQVPMPCARYCLSHVTQAPEQRLYAACAAVFAGGTRCMQPLLPLQDQTPLCAEHAWKRDNYDKLSRDSKPKKPPAVRKRVWTSAAKPPRRAKRRRRAPPAPAPVPAPAPMPQMSLSEINVCSNSSTYDSSEDTGIGGLSENEYITSADTAHELEVEVGQVPADDILDPSVLSQIPDVAFTEFFNQAEGGAPFAESSELAAALEAVLDERALDSIADCFTPTQRLNKMQQVPSTSASSLPSTPS